MTDLLVPGLLLLCAALALFRRVDLYRALLTGAADGLRLLRTIFPALLFFLSGLSMLRASGAADALTGRADRS